MSSTPRLHSVVKPFNSAWSGDGAQHSQPSNRTHSPSRATEGSVSTRLTTAMASAQEMVPAATVTFPGAGAAAPQSSPAAPSAMAGGIDAAAMTTSAASPAQRRNDMSRLYDSPRRPRVTDLTSGDFPAQRAHLYDGVNVGVQKIQADSVVRHLPTVHLAQGFLAAIDFAHRQSRHTCARSCRFIRRAKRNTCLKGTHHYFLTFFR